MPVGVVPRQPGDLEADDDAGLAHADVGDEPLEAFPALGAGAGAAQVIVDDDDLVGGPAERHGPAAQRVLAVGGGGVLQHLAQRALPDIEVGGPAQLLDGHLLGHVLAHQLAARRAGQRHRRQHSDDLGWRSGRG